MAGQEIRGCWFCTNTRLFFSHAYDGFDHASSQAVVPHQEWNPDSHMHILHCVYLCEMAACALDLEFEYSPALLDIILPNSSSSSPDKKILKRDARLLAAVYELHNYCRNNSRPIRSIEMGAKMIRRLMCDVSTRGKHTKHKKSFAKRKMALILAPST